MWWRTAQYQMNRQDHHCLMTSTKRPLTWVASLSNTSKSACCQAIGHLCCSRLVSRRSTLCNSIRRCVGVNYNTLKAGVRKPLMICNCQCQMSAMCTSISSHTAGWIVMLCNLRPIHVCIFSPCGTIVSSMNNIEGYPDQT
ncbi:unnamed protein product [Albugo candida]|uniref:Uncharacterized protein n=1 Tax=Albugo candida TaxID=65357 RepID=A0A024G047_9STRA|nr:unnamed protein product [Albugo candida]|eukprot:CCI40227.1 unnamed protein product [Albugo candida]